MNNVEKIKPSGIFTNYIYKAIPLAFDESMSYYETLCGVLSLLKTQEEVVNNNADLLAELELYAKNYFTDLNVQTEIDNKLDQMAQDGTLAQIINEDLFSSLNSKYTKALVTYNTIDDMINDETIELEQIIYVLGNKNIGDGYSGYYKIVKNGVINGNYCIKLNNNYYAILINEIEENFYKEIYYEKKRLNNTTYYLTYIPFKDSNDNIINLEVSKTDKNITPNQHAIKNNTNITINASLSLLDGDRYVDGIAIGNGIILRDYDISSLATDEQYLGITNNRTMMTFSKDTTAQTMLNAGIKNAFLIFGQCVINGSIVDNFTHHLKNDADQYIGQKANKDIIILTCEGRNSNNLGLNYKSASNILINLGCNNVYALDGGGSTSTSYRSTKLNSDIDDDGTIDRKVTFVLDVKKTITNKKTADIYGMIGKVKHLLYNELRPLINNKESKNLITKVKITNQVIHPNSERGEKLTSYIPSSPTNEIIKVENGDIKLILPDSHQGNLPYNVEINGHIILLNNTSSNTSLYLYILENNNVESTYRITVGSHDYTTICINEIMSNISSEHTYSLYINCGDTSNTISIIDGNLFVKYIAKNTSYI